MGQMLAFIGMILAMGWQLYAGVKAVEYLHQAASMVGFNPPLEMPAFLWALVMFGLYCASCAGLNFWRKFCYKIIT